MDETPICCTEEFKKAFTEEQRKTLILGVIGSVDAKHLALVANIHGLGALGLREGMRGYIEELMKKEKENDRQSK